ncbi:MAG TPA: DUF5939 domain-containing protein, partial [Abditibacteriaceae bacterium]|nr:DUF5939 domain-containing protein [Abditibacteriaceae bacterium]
MPQNKQGRTQKYSVEREVPLPRALVWEFLSNTEHLNRVIGLPPVQYGTLADGSSSFREASARLAGQTLRWIEHPFEWVQNESYAVVREYSSGPFQRFHGGIELKDGEATPDGVPTTRVRFFADFTPAHALGALIIPFAARDALRKSMAYCEAYLRLRASGDEHALPPAFKSPINTTQLEHLLKTLLQQPVAQSYVPRLGAYLRERADDEVAELRPYKLAAQWNADPDEVLRLCLYATKIGLLNLEWNLMCPNCRVSKSTVNSLAKIEEQFHCDFCGVAYDANFDRSVELRFGVHPNVRAASSQIYCIGGPYITPHRLVQRVIERGGSAT